ncbi:translation initiation factor IF-2 [bacterium]|nr:translation initiation factor IF-2 [bacterium]
MDLEKSRKLYQVAKELNLGHETLIAFLNDKGFETPKKHMSIVTSEMYQELVKKFQANRWSRHLDSLRETKEIVKRHQTEELRERELDYILKQNIEKESVKKSKISVEAPPSKPETADIPITEEIQPVSTAVEVELAGVYQEEATVEKPISAEKVEIDKEVKTEPEKKVRVKEAEIEIEESVTKEEIKEAYAEKEIPKKIGTAEEEISIKAGIEAEIILIKVDLKSGEMRPVDEVIAEAMLKSEKTKTKPERLISEKPKKAEEKSRGLKSPEAKKIEKTKEDEGAEQVRKKSRRRKKPRKPQQLSAAAVDIEQEIKTKKAKKKLSAPEEARKPTGKRRRKAKKKVDLKEVNATVKETLAKIEERGRVKYKKHKHVMKEVVQEEEDIIKVTEFISAQELANLMGVQATELLQKAIGLGMMISINQRLDRDSIELLADDFGFKVEFTSFEEEFEEMAVEQGKAIESRNPVVTVMGHVDHGKTSLLDYIRKSNIIAGEYGGITQHIGAYEIDYSGRRITFLDTPGHEAFTAMRARGAQVTDIVVLVVAADDQVMPQTIEAINHAQAAGVPIIIAINKIDKPNALPERVRQQLAAINILVEDWGGKYQCAEISAKFGKGVDNLMDEIILLADLLELKAPVDIKAQGIIIDAKLDRGRGPLATVLVQKGVLKVGDNFIAGQYSGKIRALMDERGSIRTEAGPSAPVQVIGFTGVPQPGDKLVVTETEREAKLISLKRQALQREQNFRQIRRLTLEQIAERIKHGEIKELPLILKGDVHGSIEALADELMKLHSTEVSVDIIHKGVGAISESDVLLASASYAIIIGFHVQANQKARELAEKEQVEIKSYRVIYDVIDDVKRTLEGMLRPDIKEEIVGEAEVRNTFKISTIGTIAGCYIASGKIERASKIRIYREGFEIWDGEILNLKRFKDDVKEALSGFECGMTIRNFNDIKVGDNIQAYKVVETKRALTI